MIDIFRKRKWDEAYLPPPDINEMIAAAQKAREHYVPYVPDANLPAYLKDRRGELYNPMKENRLTFTEMRCISKMQKMGMWNYDRDGTGYPEEGKELKKVDSLVESAYNSEKNLEWLKIGGCPVKCPVPSEQSDLDVNLFDS
jgi:hypothetical protein